MSMTGLDRITERILSDAELEAARILSNAEAECQAIRESYSNRAEEIRAELTAEAEKEAAERVARARSSAATQKRNHILTRKSELVDSVFDETLAKMRNLEGEKYTSLLVGLLSACLIEQMEAERISRTLYGEEEAHEPDAYEVILNMRDRDRYGKAILDGARKKLTGKLPKEKLSRLALADVTAPIDAGLILRCGDIETNCSFSLLFAQLREELEGEVGQALFSPRRRN